MDNNFNSGELLDRINDLIRSGFNYPDKDGFRNVKDKYNILTNNSYSHKDLVNTLVDINDHNSNNLKSSNSDTVNFFKWSGKINDLEKFPNEHICEFRFPLNQIIGQKERNIFKWSQFYRKWVTINDIYENWNIFKFNILLFINDKIYTEYKFWIDDKEVIINFKYFDPWIRTNATISFYKFDTLYQKRIKINREYMENQWNWQIPIDYFDDDQILNYQNLICSVNRISEGRSDSLTNIEIISNNLEFVSIHGGYVDCSNFTDKTRMTIHSEYSESLWLSVFVPKNLHEYPIILPTDYIIQPHKSKFNKVYTSNLDKELKQLSDSNKNIYVDLNENSSESDGWLETIRPIVLSDAFIENDYSYKDFLTYVDNLRNATVECADLVEEFRFYLKESIVNSVFDSHVNKIKNSIQKIYNLYKAFLIKEEANIDIKFEKQLIVVNKIIEDIENNRQYSKYLKNNKIVSTSFWDEISPIIYIPRNICDKFYNIKIINSFKVNSIWEVPEDYRNKIRFSRPVKENDIWIFEYNFNDRAWIPNLNVKVQYCYPDVYLLSIDNEDISNRIFKAFIFYSDLINIREEITDQIESSVQWEEDLNNYKIDQFGKFHDLFIEKFYWMSLKEVYPNTRRTNYRYEIIESVMNNSFYQAFNNLFLETIDPYFKINLLSYFKSEFFNFPNDSALNDFKKAIDLQVNDFKNLIAYELYLHKNWKPSYFDYKTTIDDSINSENGFSEFKFENIYDLDIQYEVFINGLQITDHSLIHQNFSEASKIDSVFIKDEYINTLKNNKLEIHKKTPNIYKVTNVNILDPGTGYAEDQNIYLKINNNIVKFKVTKVTNPLKGIAEIDIDKLHEYDFDPSVIDTTVLKSTFENIDDEFGYSYYDELTYPGIEKPATFSYDGYTFTSRRFDNMINDPRNENFMHMNITTMKESFPLNGDPEYNYYLGSRVNNLQINQYFVNNWLGIIPLNFVTNSFINDFKRYPTPNYKNEYQLFKVELFHKDEDYKTADLYVYNVEDFPTDISDWQDCTVGKTVILQNDPYYDGKRMKYRVRGFYKSGKIIYNLPLNAEISNDEIDINWSKIDFYPELPTLKEQYESAPWDSVSFYREIEEQISDKKLKPDFKIKRLNLTSYIHDITIDDLVVYNCNTNEWEDLTNTNRWELIQTQDGFKLKFKEDGFYSYVFKFYFNKSASNQLRNYNLIRPARLSIDAIKTQSEYSEVKYIDTNLNKKLMIRKIFPYDYSTEASIKYNQYFLNIQIPPYMHFRNEIHLEDIKIFNKSTGEYENILDTSKFRVDVYNDLAVEKTNETFIDVDKIIISNPGSDFIDGLVWGWNDFYKIYIFGEVLTSNGKIESFRLIYSSELPKINTTINFDLYQTKSQSISTKGSLLVEIKEKTLFVMEDGFIQGVTNPLAPIPDRFRIFVRYPIPKDAEIKYKITIDKNRKEFIVSDSHNQIMPSFIVNDYLNQDNICILTSHGRLPRINPNTLKPNYIVQKIESGTLIKLMNVYQANTPIQIISEPYPMRSVFTLRSVPSHGYINVAGKLNKPLSKKYFEFWCNGKLLTDEVSIISPTKLILHGLTSLRNFEIIEINRDLNEYFSNSFVETDKNNEEHPFVKWNLNNYLDSALDGTLPNNYSKDELRSLLYPVYPQVPEKDPNYSKYPINQDLDPDVLNLVDSINLSDDIKLLFNILVFNVPTINNIQVNHSMTFKEIGFRPISDQMLIDELNNEWQEEINTNPYFDKHIIISKDEWYGVVGFGFDENGNITTDKSKIAYSVTNPKCININTNSKTIKIIDLNK